MKKPMPKPPAKSAAPAKKWGEGSRKDRMADAVAERMMKGKKVR